MRFIWTTHRFIAVNSVRIFHSYGASLIHSRLPSQSNALKMFANVEFDVKSARTKERKCVCVCISIKLISLKSDENTSTNYGKWSFYSFMSMYKKFIEHHIFAKTQTK